MGAASSVGTGDAAGVAQALDKLNAEVQAAGAASPDQLRALRAQLAKLTDATQARIICTGVQRALYKQ